MRSSILLGAAAIAADGVLAAREFLDWPDTGLQNVVSNVAAGTLPPLDSMVGLPDFEWAAKNYLPIQNYTYYRNGAGGEWSYRNNLEVFNRYRFSPKQMRDITNVASTLNTTILGYEFSSPFYIAPCSRATYAHPEGELNLVQAAAYGDILYMVAGYSSYPFQDVMANATADQVVFSQLYFNGNVSANIAQIRASEAAGAKAIVWSVDSPGSPDRQRAARYDVGSGNAAFVKNTWQLYDVYRNATRLPIVLKGIQNAADARAAVDHGVPAIVLSNHGGRNLDGSPSSLEVALEIHEQDPDLFNQIDVLADGGVRYGTDALKLLALGVKAVGLGRPFMFANVYGVPGVTKVVDLMRTAITNDAANLGVEDLKNLDASFLNLSPNHWYS